MDIANGVWKSSCLAAALELGVFDLLKSTKHLKKEALTEQLGIQSFAIPEDFFDALVTMGLLLRDDEGYYSNPEDVEAFCTKGSENYMGILLYNKAS